MEFVIVIRGAAVERNGGPSDPMRRRVNGVLGSAAPDRKMEMLKFLPVLRIEADDADRLPGVDALP